ncbi:hypothetical protein V8F20_000274 [Naviculisporaceae sp. PSN 640]
MYEDVIVFNNNGDQYAVHEGYYGPFDRLVERQPRQEHLHVNSYCLKAIMFVTPVWCWWFIYREDIRQERKKAELCGREETQASRNGIPDAGVKADIYLGEVRPANSQYLLGIEIKRMSI